MRPATRVSLTSIKKLLIGGIIGNLFEWYDVAIYAYFARTISKLFFPMKGPTSSLMLIFAIFAIGYLMRPIGGVIFGHLGDKIGRKYALQISIIAMAIPTMMIGLLPTYATIGFVAPLLLLIMRMLQGLSSGGELTGSISFLIESAPQRMRGLVGAITVSGAAAGVLVGSIVGTVFHFMFTQSEIISGVWRIPFIIGAATGFVGLWIRSQFTESPEFVELSDKKLLVKVPIVEACRTSFPQMIQVILMAMLMETCFYILYVWMPSYLHVIFDRIIKHVLVYNSLILLLLIIMVPFAGWLTDKIGKKPVAMVGVVGLSVFSYPLFLLIAHGDLPMLLIALVLFTIFIACIEGVIPVAIVDLFKPRIRYSAVSFSYNLATAVFGGAAPLVCTYLIHASNVLVAPSFYIVALSLLSLPAYLKLSNKRN